MAGGKPATLHRGTSYAARTLWVTIHKWGGLVLSIAAVVHFILHWEWLVRLMRRIFTRHRQVA